MTYTTRNNLRALIEYLADYILEEIGDTAVSTPAFGEIQAMMVGTLTNGIDAFCGGANPAGLRYEVSISSDDACMPVVFEQWSVRDIREHIQEDGWTSEDLPTLFSLDDTRLRELLEHCVRKGYSFYSNYEGLMLRELEDLAECYFREQP